MANLRMLLHIAKANAERSVCLLLLAVTGSLGADGERPQRSLVHLKGTAIVRSLETGALTRLASTEGIEVTPGDLIGIGLDLKYEWRYVWTGREPEPVRFWERENGKYIELMRDGMDGPVGLRSLWRVMAMPDMPESWRPWSSLESLDLESTDLRDPSGLTVLTRLRYLSLNQDYTLQSVKPIGRLRELSTLILASCMQLRDISVLAQLPKLRRLDIRGCERVTDLAPLGQMASLQRLLVDVRRAKDMVALSTASGLTHLDVTCKGKALRLSELYSLEALESLRLTSFQDAGALPWVAELPQLRELHVIDCGVQRLDSLKGSDRLEVLRLWGCRSLDSLEGVEDLKALREVDLWGCPGVKDLSPLRALPNLQVLRISQCPEAGGLAALGRMPALRLLAIGPGCAPLEQEIEEFRKRNPQCGLSY